MTREQCSMVIQYSMLIDSIGGMIPIASRQGTIHKNPLQRHNVLALHDWEKTLTILRK